MSDHASHKAPATERMYRDLFKNHILPAWGSWLVTEVSWGDVGTGTNPPAIAPKKTSA